MPKPLRCVSPSALIAGWDFSTGSVKCLAFDLSGTVVAEVRLPTDLWTEGGVSELNLMQLEGQARTSVRALVHRLHELGRLGDWQAGGISATHHTAGRIDAEHNQVRRAICWNDQTLARYHAEGLERLGGQEHVRKLIGGPWAVRYSLSHLVKDGHTLSEADWKRTRWMLPHGPLSAGYLTGRFDCISISSAASTGILDLRTGKWCRDMLGALAESEHRELAWTNLPNLIDMAVPIGSLSDSLALEAGLPAGIRPLVFPTLDDQAAGLVGGGAVDAGQVAVILGNSAVVNSSSATLPQSGTLDAMRLNWGPYLWMRCYSNGAQFLDKVVGANPDWPALERAARAVPPGTNGTEVLPFVLAEPSIGVLAPRYEWLPGQPADVGIRVRAAFEALAYLIALAVREHEAAGQTITRITVSGGIARSELMGEILASVLNRPLERLVSSEGPALGAAVAALAGLETYRRKQQGIAEPYTVADAVGTMVKFRDPVAPRPEWAAAYLDGLRRFEARVRP
jgi:sugar (pentulose or hexulose) kinase